MKQYRMKLMIGFLLPLLAGSLAMAGGHADSVLLRAITLCPSPNNPMDAIKALGGNMFESTDASFSDVDGAEALVLKNFKAEDTTSKTAPIFKGKIEITMFHGKMGGPLVCRLIVLPK